MSEITLLIPKSIDLDNIILKTQLEGTPGFHKDKLAYLIYIIYNVGSRKFDIFESNGFVSLQMRMLNMVARNAKLYYESLEKERIVKVNNQYIVGEKSRAYKLLAPYNNDPVVEYIITHNVTKRGIKKAWKDIKLNNESGLIGYEHLTKWYTESLSIDKDLSEDFCDLYYEYRLKTQEEEKLKLGEEWFNSGYNYMGRKNMFLDEKEDQRWRKAFSYEEKKLKFGILNIINADHLLKVDSTSFRLHGPLTILKSELRNLLSYDGKPLVSLDLKNSQPFFSLILLNKDFWKGRTTRGFDSEILSVYDFNLISSQLNAPPSKIMKTKVRRFASEINLDIKINKIDTQLDCLIMIAIYSKLTKKTYSVAKYIEKVENGTIYDFMAIEYSKTFKEEVNRSKAKEMMFITLFSSNQYRVQEEAKGKRLFISLFPLIEAIFQVIKFKNKSLLAILLQTIESHMFLKVITKRIAKEKPELPIFTVHDSIITTLGEEEYVKSIMVDELTKAVGHSPEIKIEYYNEENFFIETAKYGKEKTE